MHFIAKGKYTGILVNMNISLTIMFLYQGKVCLENQYYSQPYRTNYLQSVFIIYISTIKNTRLTQIRGKTVVLFPIVGNVH